MLKYLETLVEAVVPDMQKILLASLLILLSSGSILAQRRSTQAERLVARALMQIQAAEMTYSATTGSGNFGSLTNLFEQGFIDAPLASGKKFGYSFSVSTTPFTQTTPASFIVRATPLRYPKTGRLSFYADATGDIRGADKSGQPADGSEPAIDTCMSAFEQCTIGNFRMLHGAEMTYASTSGAGLYGTLTQLAAGNLIRASMASGTFGGYSYSVTTTAPSASAPARFTISAIPLIYGATGNRSFFIDESGVLRGADHNGEPATVNDPPIEN